MCSVQALGLTSLNFHFGGKGSGSIMAVRFRVLVPRHSDASNWVAVQELE